MSRSAFVLVAMGLFTHVTLPLRVDGANAVIAVSGDSSPGGNGDFATFKTPALNNSGQVAFCATLTGTAGGTDDDTGMFRGTIASVVEIIRESDASPDGNGTLELLFESGGDPAINEAGEVQFGATFLNTLSPPGDAGSGVLEGNGSTLILVARPGNPSPDGNGTFNGGVAGRAGFNDAGQVSFSGGIRDASPSLSNTGMFRGDGSTLTLIARMGIRPRTATVHTSA